jgi:hypothetical protein
MEIKMVMPNLQKKGMLKTLLPLKTKTNIEISSKRDYADFTYYLYHFKSCSNGYEKTSPKLDVMKKLISRQISIQT